MGSGPNDKGASRRVIREQVEASLRRLQTDWIDLYQIHCWDATTPLDETVSTLDDLVREGKVRYVGASNYTGWQLATALGVAREHGWEPYVSLQPQYSLVSRDIERELLPLAGYAGLAVLPWSPLGGGLLSGKYRPGEAPPADTRATDTTPSALLMRMRMAEERNFAVAQAVADLADELGKTMAQVALNWVLHAPGVTAPILGARTVAQIEDNLGAVGWSLGADARQRLDDASAFERGYPYDFIDWIHSR
jgi:aryl-alcohol dehydrogenase-like predicted oxidoreductase